MKRYLIEVRITLALFYGLYLWWLHLTQTIMATPLIFDPPVKLSTFFKENADSKTELDTLIIEPKKKKKKKKHKLIIDI